jgi:hypothetical protein
VGRVRDAYRETRCWLGKRENVQEMSVMLGWDVSNLTITGGNSVVRTFDFEVEFTGGLSLLEHKVRGDGIVLSTGRVRFNHEAELKNLVAEAGGNPQYFLDALADVVARQAWQPPPRTLSGPRAS